MKHLLMIILSFVCLNSANSQSKVIKINKSAFAPRYILPKGETLYIDGKPIIIKEPLDMKIVDEVGDSIRVIVQNKKANGILQFDGSTTTSLYVGEGAFLHVKYRDWDTSPLAIPIKIRPSAEDVPMQFVGEFTLGPYIGYQTGSKSLMDSDNYNYSQTISAFAAPTMVKINPDVAQTEMSNLVLGFSLGLGYIVSLNDFQIGLVSGLDYISGDASKTWIYQGKPWFSFTVGFDFNDEESK